jgi:catechol 2,3-dioxygenase-like lactoylglutathione lyase family enzyme
VRAPFRAPVDIDGAAANGTLRPMRHGHVELFVRDPLASREFYERVLGFTVDEVQHGGAVIWLRLGDRELLLRKGEPPAPSPDYQHCGKAIVLFTDDLDRQVRELESRGLVFRGDDGPNCPTFTDPDGHWFQLVDPRKA